MCWVLKILGCCYRDNAGIFIEVGPQQETGLFRIRSWVGSWNVDLGLSLYPICYECVCSSILWAIRKCTWWIFSICSESSQVPWGSLGLPNDNCYSILSYLFRKLKSVWSVNSRYYLWSFRKHTWQINKWRSWFGEESLDASQAPGQSSSCNTCRHLDQFFILYTIRRSSYVNLCLSYPLSMTMPVRYTFKLSGKLTVG